MLVCWLSVVKAEQVTVEVNGINDVIQENIYAYLTFFDNAEKTTLRDSLLKKLNASSIDLSVSHIKRAHQLAPREIRDAVQPFGYYSPTINATLKYTENGWLARYDIDLGKPVILRQVDIQVEGEGQNDKPINDVLSEINLIPGERLEHSRYESAKDNLLAAAFSTGYLDARFNQSELRVNTVSRTADIVLILDTGPRFYFGPVTFRQDALEPDFVKRFVPFKRGDPFNSIQLIDLQLVLEDTDYFTEVEVQAVRQQTTVNHIPVEVSAKRNRPRRYTAGAGFGTDTGPRINLGIQFRRVNRYGHQFRSDLRASVIDTSFQSQYQIPIRKVTTDKLTVTASVFDEEIGDIDTNRQLLGIGRSEHWRGFQRQLYLSYQQEDFDIGLGDQDSELLIPGFSLTRQKADDPLFPRRGYGFHADVHGGIDGFVSDTDFIQGTVSIRSVWPLGERARLLVYGEYGATGVDNFSLLPPSQRFFAGGDRSVRGYRYQDLAPVNDDGDRIGGKYLITSSIELEYLVRGNYGAAIFFDAGNADDDPTPSLKKGVGIGARYRSPIGMVRLDLAHPLDDEKRDVRFHVSIGADL